MGTDRALVAEGEGFEPSTPDSQGKRLAGARTRPLCDPSACGAFYRIAVRRRVQPARIRAFNNALTVATQNGTQYVSGTFQ